MKANKALVMHPGTYQVLLDKAGESDPLAGQAFHDLPGFVPWFTISGCQIYVTKHAPQFRERFVVPSEPFIEYEESDHDWLAYFGFGAWVSTGERWIAEIDMGPPCSDPFGAVIGPALQAAGAYRP